MVVAEVSRVRVLEKSVLQLIQIWTLPCEREELNQLNSV
jgi:hypothetical protein